MRVGLVMRVKDSVMRFEIWEFRVQFCGFRGVVPPCIHAGRRWDKGFGFSVSDLAFSARVQGLGFRVQGFGLSVRVQGQGLGFKVRVQGLGFKVQGLGLGFRVQGLGCRVQGLGFRSVVSPCIHAGRRWDKKPLFGWAGTRAQRSETHYEMN